MYLENPLGDVETNSRNRLHDLAPANRGGRKSTHFHGTHVPVEEPSTASKADVTVSSRHLGAGHDSNLLEVLHGACRSPH